MWGQLEMQKGQTIEEQAGARCAGRSDGDAQQLCCFFSLLTLLLLLFFFFIL
jgi:hypothetical protein